MSKLDSHQHFWIFDALRDGWITADMEKLRNDFLPPDLELSLNASRMDGCIAVQASQSVDETMFLLELAGKYPFIKAVVGWADLCSGDIEEQLQELQKYPDLKGFRHLLQDEPDDRFMLGAAFRRGLACLQRLGYTFDLLICTRHLPYAAELALEFPRLNLVIDHIAKPVLQSKPEAAWLKGMDRISASKNVYCKISGLVTLGNSVSNKDFIPFLVHVLDCFGPERIMYGSDWPVCLLSSAYSEVAGLAEDFSARFTEEARQAFWYRNASIFYHLTR